MRNLVLYGDAVTRLKEIPDGCVQTCVTSPPYFGLRDYGTRRWFGGDLNCEHDMPQTATTAECSKCGAWYGQLGLEPTPAMYVEHMVEVFREVRRVLRGDGTFWLNVGDSYANDGKWGGSTGGKHAGALHGATSVGRGKRYTGLKPKELIGIPWMLAFALRADGWWLRAENIWNKPNAMPDSVADRTTRSHEHVFMLTKCAHYLYNADDIREPHTMKPQRRLSPIEERGSFGSRQQHTEAGYRTRDDVGVDGHPLGRNKRSVWAINTQPYKGAHFAVMPPELAATCIKAGSRVGDLVLDPFAGSGTTLMVAKDLDRDFVGIEMNEEYRPLIDERLMPSIEKAAQREIFRIAMGME